MKLKDLFEKYNLLDERINRANYHMGIFNADLYEFLIYLSSNNIFEVNGQMHEDELAKQLYSMLIKCDELSENYNEKLDKELTYYGLNKEDMPNKVR